MQTPPPHVLPTVMYTCSCWSSIKSRVFDSCYAADHQRAELQGNACDLMVVLMYSNRLLGVLYHNRHNAELPSDAMNVHKQTGLHQQGMAYACLCQLYVLSKS